MYHVDNKTGVATMPDIPPSESTVPQWFTEGGPGEEPTIPGSTTWNIWQAELLNILAAAEVVPDKFKLNQIAESIGILIANGIENAELLPGTSYKPRTDSLNTQERAVEIISNKDMNTCKAGEFGLYEKATCTNSPPSAGAFFYCETKACSHSLILTQFASGYDNNTGVMAWRNIVATGTPSGSTWCEVYDTHHKPTAADIGAAPSGHTHPGTLPDPIPLAAEDLNTIVTPNVYRQDSDAQAISALNYPEPKAGSLIVTAGAGVQQRYHVYNTSRVYTRAQYNEGAFTAWALTYNTLNIPSAADVGASPVGHTHTAAEVGAAPAIHHHNAIDGNWDIISSGWGQIGTYAFAGRFDSGGQLSPGDVIAGSSIHLCNGEGVLVGVSPPGTWKCLGYVKGDRDYGVWNVTLFIRIV